MGIDELTSQTQHEGPFLAATTKRAFAQSLSAKAVKWIHLSPFAIDTTYLWLVLSTIVAVMVPGLRYRIPSAQEYEKGSWFIYSIGLMISFFCFQYQIPDYPDVCKLPVVRQICDIYIKWVVNVDKHLTCVTRKQTLRSLSLSYQKRHGRGRAHPSFGMTPTFQNLTLLTS